MSRNERLRMYRHVVDQGGFERAAHALGVAPERLREEIAQLERELRARLMYHGGAAINLTPIGTACYVREVRRTEGWLGGRSGLPTAA